MIDKLLLLVVDCFVYFQNDYHHLVFLSVVLGRRTHVVEGAFERLLHGLARGGELISVMLNAAPDRLAVRLHLLRPAPAQKKS